MVLTTGARLIKNHYSVMTPSDDENQMQKRFGDLTFQLVGVGTVALIATCIRVWAGMDVIQAQINNLIKSDSQQDVRIESVRTEVNNLRVNIGVLRETVRHNTGGR